MRRFIKWFKIRFLFTDQQLLDTIQFFERVDRDLLQDERLWAEVEYNKWLLQKELARRG